MMAGQALLFPGGGNEQQALLSYAASLPQKAAPKSLMQRIMDETTIGGMLKDAGNAVTLPGDVYAGRVDPNSDEAFKRQFDLAGLVSVSSGAVPASKGPGVELRSGIRAYHGSPHDFDRFDLSKIGTGEGAQAYGHGLYFAGDEAVARSYRDKLAGAAQADWSFKTPLSVADHYLHIGNDSVKEALALAREQAKMPSMQKHAPRIEEAIKLLESGKVGPQKGRMYEVNINADPAKMLDYDSALPMGHPLRGEFDRAGRQLMESGDDGFTRNVGRDAAMAARNENLTGDGAYRNMTNLMEASRPALRGKYGDEAMFAAPSELARRELLARDIPGIKYLDQGSRAAGDGSRNYVVFDDALVEILRKYGLAGMAALPAGAMGAGAMMQDGTEQ